MSEIKITAEPRTDFGKGYARRIRAVGDIPAVIYGNGKEPKHVILPGHATTMAVRNKDVVLVIEVDGEQFKTRVQDIQRHPIRPRTAAHRPAVRRLRSGRRRSARRINVYAGTCFRGFSATVRLVSASGGCEPLPYFPPTYGVHPSLPFGSDAR